MGKKLLNILFTMNPEDSQTVRHEFFISNLQRWKLYFWIGIPVSLAHIILFQINLDPSDAVDFHWRKGIILMHGVLILLAVSFGSYAFIVSRKRQIASRSDLLMGPLFYILLIFSGVIITGIDQQVTTAITPFLVVCILTGLFFLVNPIFVAGIGLVSYLFFFFMMKRVQPDADVLLSNQVNGITAVSLCIGLSAILWNAGLKQKRQHRLIAKQARELEEVNITKDRFFSIIAHDLFGPVAGISSYLEIMQEESQTVTGGRAEMYKTIGRLRDSADNTLRLIENLMTWAQTQKKNISFNPVPTDIWEILDESVQSVLPQFSKKNIAVSLPEKDHAIIINGDSNMLQTIFRNLLSNAIKFSHPESRIRITIEESDQLVSVSIIDQGIGIPVDIQAKLFQVGEKITSRGTAYEPGTGLGLILCKEFIDQHLGRIIVESEAGKGSRFTVELPLA